MPRKNAHEIVSTLGRGMFSTAYLRRDGKVLLKSDDHVKEAMSMGFFPNSRLFPRIERIGHDGERQHYLMPRYRKVTAPKRQLLPQDYAVYRALRELSGRFSDAAELSARFERLECRRTRKALLGAVDGLRNYSNEIGFEISPRNIALSPSGRLLLLDCFFMVQQLHDKRREREQRMRNRGWY